MLLLLTYEHEFRNNNLGIERSLSTTFSNVERDKNKEATSRSLGESQHKCVFGYAVVKIDFD
jgi:squalene cyclase